MKFELNYNRDIPQIHMFWYLAQESTDCPKSPHTCYISKYLHFMDLAVLRGHRDGQHGTWSVASSFVTPSVTFVVLKGQGISNGGS
jgi:hypothetical protein